MNNKRIRRHIERQHDNYETLEFVGDIVLLSYSEGKLQRVVEELHRESLKVSLKMNMKTKVMFNNNLAGQQKIIWNKILWITDE